jgi:uncharacterized protein YoxC
MITEASIIIIALAFAVLTVFLVITLRQARKTLESTRKDLHHVSTEAIQMMKKIEELTSDIKSKSESLNFVFRPLKSLNKPKNEETETATEVMSWVTLSLILFEKIRAAAKHHAK